MNFRIHLPDFLTGRFPEAVWNIQNGKRKVYLTFDDGPVPVITPWVLKLLDDENIKATFFCVGENVIRHRDIFYRIKESGHMVGNHTFNHLSGIKTNNFFYYKNISRADELIQSTLFRPPYGLLSKQQYKFLSLKYKIIMWDVISRDYDSKISGEQVVNNVLEYIRPGSIIVFHDSVKAEKNLCYALPRIIESLKKQNYIFDKIEIN